MARIFLSYRRADGVASGARSLIYQKLQEHYGAKSVFMDVERMEVARDFRECLQEELVNTDVMLVLIGPDWTQLMQQRGGSEDDFVLIEIETALRLDKPVLPLLLGGAHMPTAKQMPDSIKAFTFIHGVELDTGRYFNEGMSRLCEDLDEHIFKGHISRKKLHKGFWYVGAAVALMMIVALVALMMGGKSMQPVVERTAASTEKIAVHTEKMVASTEAISGDTKEMAKSLNKIASSFESLKTDGIIEQADSANEFYHNARIHELEGDYVKARAAYLGYFKFKQDKIDPHLRYTAMLRVQEGLEGARESYALLANTFPAGVLAPHLAKVLLYPRAQRVPKLQQLASEHPDYAPVYHFLALDYSADRLGARSIGDMREQKVYLARFQELDQAGKLLRHFVDQEPASAWRISSDAALKELQAQMATSVLENPVRLTWMKHNAGWNGNVAIAEAITELWWKTAEMEDFKKTPMMDYVDNRTGKMMPTPYFPLTTKQGATEISIKYLDRNAVERGPFKFSFKPRVESSKSDIKVLQMMTTSWVSFREFDGKLLLYYSALLSYRGAIEKITYGLDQETPDTDFPFTAWNQPGMAEITEDMQIYLSVAKETRFVTVQLTYKNGEKSEVVRFER